jgi:hypothetical protein
MRQFPFRRRRKLNSACSIKLLCHHANFIRELYILHRRDLGMAAACGSALHAETRPEARLAQGRRHADAEAAERVGKADRGRLMAVTSTWGWVSSHFRSILDLKGP